MKTLWAWQARLAISSARMIFLTLFGLGPNRQIPCEHCKGMFAFQMLEKHTENDCAEIPLRCASIFKNDGCMEMILRKDLDSHRKDKCGK